MNNTLATHFHDYFGMDLVSAGGLAMSFGAMNLFARSLGGILSDWANARWQMQGRLWMHFISLFVHMAEGTSYGIVPYMIPQDLAIVSAVVGAGGTLGAVIATWSFYKSIQDVLLPFKLHACYVMFWALTVLPMRWDHLGSMWWRPGNDKAAGAKDAPATSAA